MTEPAPVAPAHVPPDLVIPFDQLNGPETSAFPPTAVVEAAKGRPVFYSSFYGGFWVFTRYDQVREAFQSPGLFHQWAKGIPANPYTKLYKPLYLDPPEHMAYRKVLTPLFSPRQMARLEGLVRQTAREQLARIAPVGRCEFVKDFAGVLSSTMFCGQLGLPIGEYPRFGRMADDLIFGPANVLRKGGTVEDARAVRAKANREIDELVGALIPERRLHPGEDIVSLLLDGEVDGAPLPEEEIVNMTTLLFFAGTDSTRSAIAYAFIHLAQHPEHRDRLVADPTNSKAAAEELLRYNAFHNLAREVAHDAEFCGVQLKKGDVVVLSCSAANRDAAKFPDPETVDLDRANAHSHLTYGAGVHRCIGSHLATLQLRVALEEVHKVIKDYRLDASAEPVRYVGGQGKATPENLPLFYTPVVLAADR